MAITYSVLILFTVIAIVLLIRRQPFRGFHNSVAIATILQGVFTPAFLLIAVLTLQQQEKADIEEFDLQRKLTAHEIYQEHMKMSIEHPELSFPEAAPHLPLRDDSLRKHFDQYRWYVGHALFSFETIFEAVESDTAWEATAKAFIYSHRNYTGSPCFPCDRYTLTVQQLVKDTLGAKNYCDMDPAERAKLCEKKM